MDESLDVNGKFSSVLRHGKYAFWSVVDQHEFKIVDISTPAVDESIPEYIFSKIPQIYYTKIEVAEYQKARLYFNQKLERILDAGTYYFWKTPIKVEVGSNLESGSNGISAELKASDAETTKTL